MKVFLSHSSVDKGFVEGVSDLLRPGTFELDSQTFDDGLINSDAIIKSLKRCDLFCLFLSEHSVNSSYVDFEILLGIEFFARGSVNKFMVICIDEESFSKASANVKIFNVVRRVLSVGSASRLIQGNLVAASAHKVQDSHPFIGREEELADLERQVTNHKRPPTKALFVSGNFGSGRRATTQKFYADQYPQVCRVFPTININEFSGLEEIYRKVVMALRPGMTASELKTRFHAFAISTEDGKRNLIAQLINSLLPAREAAFLFDNGGILTDSGALEPDINNIINFLDTKPHPPIAIISNRMIPNKLKRKEDDVSYISLKSLKPEVGERLVSRLLKDRSIRVTTEQLDELTNLGDGHPFNFYRMIDDLEERGVEAFLASTRDFIDWKHRQSSEYISKVVFSREEILILGILKIVPELDFTAISDSLPISPESVSDALLRLSNLHIVEPSAERFLVSPALRVAVERDDRLTLNKDLRTSAIRKLAQSLSVRLEEGTAPVILIDSAVLSALESGESFSGFAAAFLLPSHYVWLSKQHYNDGNYRGSIKLAKEALDRIGRLSRGGVIEACRNMCLASARIGEKDSFDEGIKKLELYSSDDFARSNISYLKGFNFRMRGNLPQAEDNFRMAYSLSPGNKSASREIAAICLARGNLEEAEGYAREAYAQAPSNPYILDILISIIIQRHGNSPKHKSEISELFDYLEKIGDENGKSFYTTRKAEFEHIWGNNKHALKLIREAYAKTSYIFETKRLYVEILLKDGNKPKALEIIREMEAQVNSRNQNENRTNYRSYLVTNSNYMVEVGRYQDAKNVFGDRSVFTEEEQKYYIKEIEFVQGAKSK
ncbi:TIR domain-containing protein [Azospirillum sp.]|uniref:TIR domain-containing protein n=1 Tax=Azospirillum sp. TaxID=34012 RepID=UPI00261E60E8|nr:TIR domain-containing protein [Azospirillum sp.]